MTKKIWHDVVPKPTKYKVRSVKPTPDMQPDLETVMINGVEVSASESDVVLRNEKTKELSVISMQLFQQFFELVIKEEKEPEKEQEKSG